MDTLVAVIVVLFLLLAVAPFFIMSGAFKRRGRLGGEGQTDTGPALYGGLGTHKSRHEDGNSSDSGDSGSDGGGDGGGGGGE